MVRYDPTQEDHKKYVKDKPDLPKQKRQKKQKVEQSKIVAEPVVDTDKYYKVGNKLKDVFSSENQFSFKSLFPASDNCKLILNIQEEYFSFKNLNQKTLNFIMEVFHLMCLLDNTYLILWVEYWVT